MTSHENGLLPPNKFCTSNVDSLTFRLNKSCEKNNSKDLHQCSMNFKLRNHYSLHCNTCITPHTPTHTTPTFHTFCVLRITLNPNSKSSSDVATVKSSLDADTLSFPWSSSHSNRVNDSIAFSETRSCRGKQSLI